MSMMDEYNAFKTKLDAAIDSTLLLVVEPIVVTDIQMSVEMNVYEKYDPTYYERREEDGGLIDKRNYVSWVENSGDIHELKIRNETKGNPRYADTEGWDPGYITDIIERGTGYHWTSSKIYRQMPYPRPFMEEALEMGIRDGSIERALGVGLSERGFTR